MLLSWKTDKAKRKQTNDERFSGVRLRLLLGDLLLILLYERDREEDLERDLEELEVDLGHRDLKRGLDDDLEVERDLREDDLLESE